MLKPLIPVINDALAHTFSEAYHVMTVHAKYGNNHLQKEITDTDSNNENSKNQNTVKSEETTTVHLSVNEHHYSFTIDRSNKIFTSLLIKNLPFIFISTLTPPPKV